MGVEDISCPVQERDDLSAGTAILRTEGYGGGAVGNVFLHCPQYGGVVEGVWFDVGKRISTAGGLGLLPGAPQKDCHLGAGADRIRRKERITYPSGNPVFCSPEDSFKVVTVWPDVGKGIVGPRRLRRAAGSP